MKLIDDLINAFKSKPKKVEQIPQTPQPAPKPTPIYDDSFFVHGTSFRQPQINKIVRNGIKEDYIVKYEGMTTKEIKECGCRVYEADNEYIDVSLNPTKYKNEDAIEVLADNYDGDDVLVGYIPKSKIKEIMPLLNKKVVVSGTLHGGKYKECNDYDEIETYEDDYTIELDIEIYDQ